jgi:hypothetical protein
VRSDTDCVVTNLFTRCVPLRVATLLFSPFSGRLDSQIACFEAKHDSLHSNVIYPISAGMRILQDFPAVLSVAELGQKHQFRIVYPGSFYLVSHPFGHRKPTVGYLPLFMQPSKRHPSCGPHLCIPTPLSHPLPYLLSTAVLFGV